MKTTNETNILRKKMDEKEIQELRRTDLKKYFKTEHTCSICKKLYGSDEKETNLICPVCYTELRKEKMESKE